MHVKSYERPLMQFAEYRLHKSLMLYIPPVLLVLGGTGNMLAIVILSRKGMRKYSTYLYLAVLSGADTLVLCFGLLRLWIGELTGNDIRNYSNWTCKVVTFTAYTASYFSGWLIIVVTAERWLAVARPLRATRILSRDRAIKVIFLLLFVLFLLNCHFFWTVEVIHIHHMGEEFPFCDAGNATMYLIHEVWPWVDALIYSFVPFVVILILNTVIIRQILKARRERLRLMHEEGQKTQIARFVPADSNKITILLLTISFVFLITTLPMNISLIANKFFTGLNIGELMTLKLVRTITELMMYCNHSINFYLYICAGSKFRAQMRGVFSNTPRRESRQTHLTEISGWPMNVTPLHKPQGHNYLEFIPLTGLKLFRGNL